MGSLSHLIAKNRSWAGRVVKDDPDFFQSLVRQQAPRYLWIGCADSRVPANEIVDLRPGELFVHRNVANLVVHTDLNCLSVLQFAVDVLKIEHVIVCGHYGCGGVAAAARGAPLGLIDNWLRHIQDVAERHRGVLERAAPQDHIDRLSELNVLEQALNVCRTTIVQDAWGRGQPLEVHGWIYRLTDGLVQDLGFCASQTAEPTAQLAQAIAALESRGLQAQPAGAVLSPDQLRLLIATGRAQGFLTYAQLVEELPPGIEPGQIELIASHLASAGVLVHERDPEV
jgi:carbonic anhydrase